MSTKKSSISLPKDERTRNWTFVVYPIEGTPPAPIEWREIVDEQHIQWIESPYHDSDLNADGSLKKPHIHVLVMYEGNKSFEQVKQLTEALNAPIPQKVANVKGLVRYFVHMDNPEKHQYSKDDIRCHGGADSAEYLKATATTRYQLIKEMMDWVRSNEVTEMEDLMTYAGVERFGDWFPLLCDNSSYVMGEFIRSRRHRSFQSVKVVKVNENGEVVE